MAITPEQWVHFANGLEIFFVEQIDGLSQNED